MHRAQRDATGGDADGPEAPWLLGGQSDAGDEIRMGVGRGRHASWRLALDHPHPYPEPIRRICAGPRASASSPVSAPGTSYHGAPSDLAGTHAHTQRTEGPHKCALECKCVGPLCARGNTANRRGRDNKTRRAIQRPFSSEAPGGRRWGRPRADATSCREPAPKV